MAHPAERKTLSSSRQQYSLSSFIVVMVNSDYTDHPFVYQSMLISFTSLLLQGVFNEKQRRVNLAITEKRRIAAIRELCRTRHASRQAFSMLLTQRRLRRINAETQRFAEERRERGMKALFSSAFLRALCVSALRLI